MCRTNSLDCELFSMQYMVYVNCSRYSWATEMLHGCCVGNSNRYIQQICLLHRCASPSLLKLTGCGSCHMNVFAKGNRAHKTIAKGMQLHWHLHICMLHLKESAVAYFPGRGKSFFPTSSICSNFTLLQFPTVFCEHCCCNTFPFRWKNKLHSPLETVTTGIQEIAGKKNTVVHIPSGQHKIGTVRNQAKKLINTDEKKIQHNPFPKLILSTFLSWQAVYMPGCLLTL